jgi:hypothetical protein
VAKNIWQPTTFLRYVRTVPSSSRTAFIQTDAGAAYLKAIRLSEWSIERDRTGLI